MKKDSLIETSVKASEKALAKFKGRENLTGELRDLSRTKKIFSSLKWILLLGVSISAVAAITGMPWMALLAVILTVTFALLSYVERGYSLKAKQLLEQMADQGEREAEVSLKIEPSSIDATPNITRNL